MARAERPNVPKFGNWDNDSNTPYTVVFDNARKNRGGKMINPNDPQENPDMFPEFAPSAPKPKPKTQTEEPVRQINTRRVSREEGDIRANSSGHSEKNPGGRVAIEPTHQRYGGGRGSNSGRPARQGAGSNFGVEKSPLHPQSQAKGTGRVAASPAWEGKNNSYDSSHGTPGRSFESARATPGRSFESARATPGRSFESARATPGRNQMKQESSDREAVVPKFGGWDENNPESGENYTEVFNKVRNERNVGSGNGLGTPGRSSYSTQRDQRNEKQKSCCFPFW